MHMKHITTIVALVVVTLLAAVPLTGCKKKAAESGFLGNYSQLAPVEGGGNMRFYFNPDKTPADYDSIMLDPLVIHFAPDAQGSALHPDKVAKVAAFAEARRKQFWDDRGVRIVEAPGPGVMRSRAAFTDIKKNEGALNILPLTKFTGLGLGGASFEAELIDSVTHERIVAVMDSRSGEMLSLKGIGEFDSAEQVIEYWLKDFGKRLVAAAENRKAAQQSR